MLYVKEIIKTRNIKRVRIEITPIFYYNTTKRIQYKKTEEVLEKVKRSHQWKGYTLLNYKVYTLAGKKNYIMITNIKMLKDLNFYS